MELAGGEAFLGGAVAGGTEGVEEAWGEVDFTGEEAAAYGYTASLRENKQACFPLSFRSSRGFLATTVEIGHCEVLLELVHNTEILMKQQARLVSQGRN